VKGPARGRNSDGERGLQLSGAIELDEGGVAERGRTLGEDP
jgi:hypothetical protein